LIRFKSRLTKKEKEKIWQFIKETPDFYSDFFITKNNQRLYIKQNIDLLFENLRKGDKIAYNKDGLIIVTGFSDNFKRHYIKILTKNEETAENLLKVLSWNLKIDLYCKLKENNIIIEVLKRNGFEFLAGRGTEVLLFRKYKEIIKEK